MHLMVISEWLILLGGLLFYACLLIIPYLIGKYILR
jgi:hypothetical protein